MTDSSSPKKVRGITENRLNTNWQWFSDESCADTCCEAYAECSSDSPDLSVSYSWDSGTWTDCSAECGGGTQCRSVACLDDTDTAVDDAWCAASTSKPVDKELCNTDACAEWTWTPSEWSACDASAECTQTRTLTCADTANDVESTQNGDECDADSVPVTQQACDASLCSKMVSEAADTAVDDDISVWLI